VASLNKVWGRKIAILGLRAPETAILRVIEETVPRRSTSTDKLEITLERLLEDQRRSQANSSGEPH
jgi:hypothetical protein